MSDERITAMPGNRFRTRRLGHARRLRFHDRPRDRWRRHLFHHRRLCTRSSINTSARRWPPPVRWLLRRVRCRVWSRRQYMEQAFKDNGVPMLEVNERGQFRDFLINQENQLNSYGWVDEKCWRGAHSDRARHGVDRAARIAGLSARQRGCKYRRRQAKRRRRNRRQRSSR